MERLEVKDLNFYYGFYQILEEINFCVEKGEIVSIVGPSGGGKTTLLKLCAGFLDVTEGEIKNSFEDWAFAFQDARLLPWQSVIDNIALALLHKKVRKKEAIERAKEFALKVGLETKDFEKYPKDLSGGMRQRVSFARALIANPSLLFLDEPFSALDVGLKKELQDLVLNQSQKKALSALFITHDLTEAVRLSDKILLLESDPGRIAKIYEINKPKNQRSDDFVFEKTIELLRDPLVIETFEIKV